MIDDIDTPPYIQMARDIAAKIHSGEYPSGFRLPPQRKLAFEYGVAPGTVARAYAELQREGLIEATVGRGSFVRPIANNDASHEIDLRANRPKRRRLAPLLFRAVRESTEEFESILFDARSHIGSGRFQGNFVREWLAKYHGVEDAAPPLLCSGGQSAVVGSVLALCEPGDVLLTEQLTYTGLIFLARLLNLRLVGIPMDEEGIDPVALEAAIRAEKPKAIVVTPNFHSPTTAFMSLARRRAIVRLAAKTGTFIIEDDVYGSYVKAPLPPLRALLPEQTILFTSLSKVVAAGIPVGIVSAPENLDAKLRNAIDLTGGMVDPTTWIVVKNWMSNGFLDSVIKDNGEEIERREAAAQEALAGLRFRSHPRCPHVWVELGDISLTAVISSLTAKGIRVLGSDHFTVDTSQTISKAIRISLSAAADTKELTQALREVVRTIEELKKSKFQIV